NTEIYTLSLHDALPILWKVGTETLFMTSGSLPFEWIERAGSYMAPLALYALIVAKREGRTIMCTRKWYCMRLFMMTLALLGVLRSEEHTSELQSQSNLV